MDLVDAVTFEFRGDQRSRHVFLKAQFRMGMQLTTNSGELAMPASKRLEGT